MSFICIFAYVLAPPPLSCAARRRRVYLFDEPTQFTGRDELTIFTCLPPHDQKSRDRFGDAELGDRAVCAMRDRL